MPSRSPERAPDLNHSVAGRLTEVRMQSRRHDALDQLLPERMPVR
jgi:hypothetical protein